MLFWFFLDTDKDFLVGKGLDDHIPHMDVHIITDCLSETPIGSSGKYQNFAVITHDISFPLKE